MSVGAGRQLPSDGEIQIAFDRYLLPATINRQSVVILDGSNMPLPPDLAPIVQYDPIARTVTLRPPKLPWLTQGQPYKLVLPIPEGNSETGGFRAIDRAVLFAGQQREFAFIVGPPAATPYEPPVSFCRDVLPIFAAKCGDPFCHGTGSVAAASLILNTSAGIGATALNRIAQGSNTGGRAGLAPAVGRQFGVDMPVIDPGNPGNSWLMYKIDLARPPVNVVGDEGYGCTNGLKEPPRPFVFAPLVPQAQRTTDDIERSILSDFILGREMPFPPAPGGELGYGLTALTFEERERVRIWIQTLPPGGSVPECGGCGFPTQAGDGGTDASLPETGTDATDASDASDAADASDGD